MKSHISFLKSMDTTQNYLIEVKKMKRWIKIATLALGLLTVSLLSISYAEHANYEPPYGDLRDYYPLGTWVKARKLTEQPKTWVELENDTYIAQAIKGEQNLTFTPINTEYDWTKNLIEEGWVWFKEDDPNSEFRKKGKPLYILWIPNGNYYKLDMDHVDGIPEYMKNLPPPSETAAFLSIPWVILIGIGIKDHKSRDVEKS